MDFAQTRLVIMEIADNKFIRISWGALGAFLAVVVSLTLWLGSVDSKATDAIQRLDRQKDTIKEIRTTVGDTDRRTIRIEAIVDELKRRTDKL